VTTSDLMFVSGKLNGRYKDSGALRVRLADIATVGVQERTWEPYTGGFRRRLRVALRNGDVRLFVAKDPERVVCELEQFVRTA
jgi:hypothetical protein